MKSTITPEDLKEIHAALEAKDSKATLLGEGEWKCDCACRVYKIEDRFISIFVINEAVYWLDDDTSRYIQESEVTKELQYQN